MGEAGGFNLYAYCGNDPVNRHDPLGLSTKLNIDGSFDFFDDGWSSFGEMRDFLNTPLGKAQTILKQVDAEIRNLSNISDYATPSERQRSTDLIGLHYKIDRFITYEQQRIQAAQCLGNTLAAEQEAARNTFGFSWLGTNGKVADLRAIGREIGAIQDHRFGDYFRDSLNSPLAYHKAAILGVSIGLTPELLALKAGSGARVLTAVDGAGRDFALAEKVRRVMPGEKFRDVLQELKAGQIFDDVEMNLVRLKGGEQWIVRGGRTGTDWSKMLDEIHRIKFHSHPRVMGGPSPDDLNALKFFEQKHSFLWERGMPDVLMFDQNGNIIRTLIGF
jgi:hypothetical protein